MFETFVLVQAAPSLLQKLKVWGPKLHSPKGRCHAWQAKGSASVAHMGRTVQAENCICLKQHSYLWQQQATCSITLEPFTFNQSSLRSSASRLLCGGTQGPWHDWLLNMMWFMLHATDHWFWPLKTAASCFITWSCANYLTKTQGLNICSCASRKLQRHNVYKQHIYIYIYCVDIPTSSIHGHHLI